MKRKVAIFEPWGLGDLAIALNLARNLYHEGYETTLLCDPRYLMWVRSLPFVSDAYGISVPWTRSTKKYALLKYPWSEWMALRKTFRITSFEFVIETRRDLRSIPLLKFLFKGPWKSPKSRQSGIGYGRLGILLPLQSPLFTSKNTHKEKKTSDSIICFFGAEWKNRRVPDWKIPDLISVLQKKYTRVGIIIPPEEKALPLYQTIREIGHETGIEPIEGNILEIANRVRSFDACVSTDTGWLHVAHLYGLKTLGLFGFDNDREWAPPGGLVLRSEHCLQGFIRYRKITDSLQPLGTLRIESFSKTIQKLANQN